jgi:hypothetical protein
MVYIDEWYGKPPPKCALPHHSHRNTFYAQMANIKTGLKKMNGWTCTGFSGFAQALLNMVMYFWVPQNKEFLDQLRNYQLLNKDSAHSYFCFPL